MSVRDILQAAAGVGGGGPPLFLWAWGNGPGGTLGLNDAVSRSSPVQLGSDNWLYTQAAAGNGSYSAAIRSDNTLWGWGSNSSGRVDNSASTTINFSSPVQKATTFGVFDSNWAYLNNNNGGGALKTDNSLWFWGDNSAGQFGNNSRTASGDPQVVGSPATTNWETYTYTGDVVVAIKTDGTLWAWGSGGSGVLGLDSVTARSSPVQVGALSDWKSVPISNQGGGVMGAIKTDGTLWMWGANSGGALGLGDGFGFNRSSPTQVGALTNWDKLSVAGSGAAAIKTDGTLWVWGINSSGQLGLNDVISRSSPVQVGAGTDYYEVVMTSFSMLFIKTDGTLWATGLDLNGALAQTASSRRSSPVQIGALSWSQIRSTGQVTFGLKE